MADQPDQKQPGTTLAFQKALTQASALWDKTPVSILDQQAAQTHALLLAMGKYITYRKEKGELESCADIAGINRAEQYWQKAKCCSRVLKPLGDCKEGECSLWRNEPDPA